MEFEGFVKKYIDAIKQKDAAFLEKVYSDWLKTSGMKAQVDAAGGFEKVILGELAAFGNFRLKKCESFDGYDIAHLENPAEPQAPNNIVFKKKGDSWVVFNEMSNKGLFKTRYSLNYNVEGGELRILFNGKRNPFVGNYMGQGFNTLINSVLKVGENEVTLESVSGAELKVDIRISGGSEGEVVDSSAGDALSYQGSVKELVTLKFKAG